MSLSAPFFTFSSRISFIASRNFALDTDLAVSISAINALGGIAIIIEMITVDARAALFPEKLSVRFTTSSILTSLLRTVSCSLCKMT